jgi:tRNA(Ile)-lysidine synthase TilS/MesJ
MMRLGQLGVVPLANKVATYRAARHEAYRRAVIKHHAQGVLLAHHADDQAETVALRLLRGVVPPARMGMLPEAMVDGLRLVRPLLGYRKQQLTEYLAAAGQGHRVDGTNDRPDQARNVVRSFLVGRDDWRDALLALHAANEEYRMNVGSLVPELAADLSVRVLADLPDPVARAAAGNWLVDRGADGEELSRQVLDRLVAMCRDAATPSRQMFPGRLTVSRRKGHLTAVRAG